MRGPINAAGANTHRSLNNVRVSASSISGPLASTTVTAAATFTRMVADGHEPDDPQRRIDRLPQPGHLGDRQALGGAHHVKMKDRFIIVRERALPRPGSGRRS
jgi:hypothetical protein